MISMNKYKNFLLLAIGCILLLFSCVKKEKFIDLDTAILNLESGKNLDTIKDSYNKPIRYAKNVYIVGEFERIALYNILIKCYTKSGDEYIFGIPMPEISIDYFDRIYDENVKKLSRGDKMEVCLNLYYNETIKRIEPLGLHFFSSKDYKKYEHNWNRIIKIEYKCDLKDADMYIKYRDKEKIYGYKEFLKDFSDAVYENWIRAQEIFNRCKVKVLAQAEHVSVENNYLIIKYKVFEYIGENDVPHFKEFKKHFLIQNCLTDKAVFIYNETASQSYKSNKERLLNDVKRNEKLFSTKELVFRFDKKNIVERSSIFPHDIRDDYEIFGKDSKIGMHNHDEEALHRIRIEASNEFLTMDKQQVIDNMKEKYQVVKFGNDDNQWIVLSSNKSVTKLLSLDIIAGIRVEYDNNKRQYINSNVYKYLNYVYIKNFGYEDLSMMIENEEGQKISILSSDEYHKYFPNYKDGALYCPYFLRTMDNFDNTDYMLAIHNDGTMHIFSDKLNILPIIQEAGIRPCIQIDTKVFNKKYGNVLKETLPFNIEMGKKFKFGRYEQDNNMENGKEDLYWYAIADYGDKVLLFCEKIIDKYLYGDDVVYQFWGTSRMKKFANNEFYNETFNTEEKYNIVTITTKNSMYNIENNNNYCIIKSQVQNIRNTYDNVFIISYEDIDINSLINEEFIKGVPTEYAVAKGVLPITEDSYSNYMIRDFIVENDDNYYYLCMVDNKIVEIKRKYEFNDKMIGFRPAIIVNKDYLLETNE